jgi:NADH:ubiquinone oxidoreductase subunit 5 (subunit L)/multisubunit Na+/H+ antiporter MnhA subunit
VVDYAIVNGVGFLSLIASRAQGWFDRYIIDGIVNLVGWITGFVGRSVRHLQTGVAQQYVFLLVAAVVIISLAAFGAAFMNHTEAAWIPRISFRF